MRWLPVNSVRTAMSASTRPPNTDSDTRRLTVATLSCWLVATIYTVNWEIGKKGLVREIGKTDANEVVWRNQ